MAFRHFRHFRFIVGFALLSTNLFAACPTPPSQPESGPGGRDYPHKELIKESFQYGESSVSNRVYLYEPSSPRPESAPVFLYLHGYMGQMEDDTRYRPFLEHMAKKGMNVIYITWGGLAEPWKWEQNVVKAYQLAILKLNRAGHVKADLERFALGGHSMGAQLATRIAARAKVNKMPLPKALVLHDGAGMNLPSYGYFPIDDLSTIPSTMILSILVAEKSWNDPLYYTYVSVPKTMKHVWNATEQIPDERKSFLLVSSDKHGCPELESGHQGINAAPEKGQALDAIDWFGYWKPTEHAVDVAFSRHADGRVSEGPEILTMGKWSDKVQVNPMLNSHDLGLR